MNKFVYVKDNMLSKKDCDNIIKTCDKSLSKSKDYQGYEYYDITDLENVDSKFSAVFVGNLIQLINRIVKKNAKGVFLGTKHCVPIMQKSGGGSIINISSIAGIAGRPMASPAYAASKGAVRVFTKSTAGRFASDGIRANSIHPGPIDTDMIKAVTTNKTSTDAFKNIPLGRLGQPEDIAYGALFLASDESSFITASELVIDGGVTGIRS